MPSRLATRWLQAIEFSSPETLKKYLQDHPNADRSKHTVKKPGGEGKEDHGHGKEDHGGEDHGDGHGGHEEKPKKSWKEALSGLSSKAKEFFQSAPKNVKRFAEDDAYRRGALMKAHEALTTAPEKATKQLIHTLKEEIHEYKEAAGAVKDLASGKKLNKHQKHALKTAAFHVGLTLAATALTTSGVGAGAAVFAKSMARHVALKAVGSMFEKAHILDEIGHVGHGVKHILDKLAAKKEKGEEGPEGDRLLLDFIRALVAKEMEGLDAEDVAEAMERASRKNDVHEASVKNAAMGDKEGVQWVYEEVLSQKVEGDTMENHIRKYLREYIRSGQAIHTLFQKALAQASAVEGSEEVTSAMCANAVYRYVVKGYGDDAMFKLLPYLITRGDFIL